MLAVATVGMLVYAVAGAAPNDGRDLKPASCAPASADCFESAAAKDDKDDKAGKGSTTTTTECDPKSGKADSGSSGKDGKDGKDSDKDSDKSGGGKVKAAATGGAGGRLTPAAEADDGKTDSTSKDDAKTDSGSSDKDDKSKDDKDDKSKDDEDADKGKDDKSKDGKDDKSKDDEDADKGKDDKSKDGKDDKAKDDDCGTTSTTGKGGKDDKSKDGKDDKSKDDEDADKGKDDKSKGDKDDKAKDGKGTTTTTRKRAGGTVDEDEGRGPTTTTTQRGSVTPLPPSGDDGMNAPGDGSAPGGTPIEPQEAPPFQDGFGSDPGSAGAPEDAADPGEDFDLWWEQEVAYDPIDAPGSGAMMPVISEIAPTKGKAARERSRSRSTGTSSRRVVSDSPQMELASAPAAAPRTSKAPAVTESARVSRRLGGLQSSSVTESAFPTTVISTPEEFPSTRNPLAAAALVLLLGVSRELFKVWRRRATDYWPA